MRKKLIVLCALASLHGWPVAQVLPPSGAPNPRPTTQPKANPAWVLEPTENQARTPAITLENWVRANAEVGKNLRGHLDLLEQEALDMDMANAQMPRSQPTLTLEPLSLNQAVKLAVKNQPEYRASTTLNALEKAALDQQVLLLSHRVHRAWIEAVGALISANQLQQVWQAAQVSAELAQRMVQVGNWSKVQAAQALLAQAAAAQQLAMARLQAFSARERLVRVLGVSGPDAQFTLVPSLPKLPAKALSMKGIEAVKEAEDLAVRNSLALALARTTAERESAGVSTSDLMAWPLAVAADLQDWPAPETKAEAVATGSGLSPLPTQAPVRQLRVPAGTHELDNAALANRQAQRLEADIRSLAREAYFRYRTAFELAKHQRDTVLVLQTLQQDETQVRYNGMLQSTWDLLASAQVRLQSVNTAQLAERDYWLAHTDLQAVLAGAVVSFSGEASPAGQATNAAQGH